jgi:hypothetical protein
MSMKSTEVRNVAQALAAEANDLSRALVNGRLRHICGGDPAATVDCHACEVAEDAAAVRRADR